MDNITKIGTMNLKPVWYYQRLMTGEVVSSCLLLNNVGDLMAKGTSLCSRRDQFVKRMGRAIALGRAVQALEHQAPNGHLHYGLRKGEYLPEGTPYEAELIKGWKKAKENYEKLCNRRQEPNPR